MAESPVPVRATWLSAHVLVHSTSSQELTNTVEAFGAIKEPVVGGLMWFYPSRSHCGLTMYLIEGISEYEADLMIEAYAQWWRPLTLTLGQEPQTALGIEVRGQDSAQEAARKLVGHILSAHPGICAVQGTDVETGAQAQFIVRPGEAGAER